MEATGLGRMFQIEWTRIFRDSLARSQRNVVGSESIMSTAPNVFLRLMSFVAGYRASLSLKMSIALQIKPGMVENSER